MRHHNNAIGFFDRRQTVGNHDAGAVLHETIQSLLHQTLRLVVKRAGRFIQNQDGCIFQNRTGNGNTLALAARQFIAIVANVHVPAFRLLLNKLPQIRSAQSIFNLRIARSRRAICNVVVQRVIEQNHILRHQGDVLT